MNEDTLKKANTELNQVTQQLEEATKNNNIIDRDKAEKIIEGLKELEEVLKESVYRYDTYLNWAASEKAAKRGGRRRKSTHRRSTRRRKH